MHPTRDDYLLLLLLGAVWGSSFLLIKLAVETIPPITVAAARIGIGALVLALIVMIRGRSWPHGRREWLLLFAMGVIGNAVPFSLINWGETRIDSGLTAILMSSVPLATIMLAPAFVRDEPVTPGKLLGVAFGMAGVAVLIGPGVLMGAHGELLGEIAITGAALCYAVNGLVARRLPQMPVEVISAGCLLSATLAVLPVSLVVDRPWQAAPSTLSLAALALLGILNTAGGYLLLFRLVVRAGAGFASLNNFLVPLFGVMWGVMLLDERPSPRAFAGLVLIFGGLAAVRLWPRRRAATGGRAER
jgi:drug/metabolite transporter (DMT)-like permease